MSLRQNSAGGAARADDESAIGGAMVRRADMERDGDRLRMRRNGRVFDRRLR